MLICYGHFVFDIYIAISQNILVIFLQFNFINCLWNVLFSISIKSGVTFYDERNYYIFMRIYKITPLIIKHTFKKLF